MQHLCAKHVLGHRTQQWRDESGQRGDSLGVLQLGRVGLEDRGQRRELHDLDSFRETVRHHLNHGDDLLERQTQAQALLRIADELTVRRQVQRGSGVIGPGPARRVQNPLQQIDIHVPSGRDVPRRQPNPVIAEGAPGGQQRRCE